MRAPWPRSRPAATPRLRHHHRHTGRRGAGAEDPERAARHRRRPVHPRHHRHRRAVQLRRLDPFDPSRRRRRARGRADPCRAATGSTSERTVRELYGLDEMALLDMGDFAGGTLKYLRRHPVARLIAGRRVRQAREAGARPHGPAFRPLAARSAGCWRGSLPATAPSRPLEEAMAGANTAGQIWHGRSGGFPLGDLVAARAREVGSRAWSGRRSRGGGARRRSAGRDRRPGGRLVSRVLILGGTSEAAALARAVAAERVGGADPVAGRTDRGGAGRGRGDAQRRLRRPGGPHRISAQPPASPPCSMPRIRLPQDHRACGQGLRRRRRAPLPPATGELAAPAGRPLARRATASPRAGLAAATRPAGVRDPGRRALPELAGPTRSPSSCAASPGPPTCRTT